VAAGAQAGLTGDEELTGEVAAVVFANPATGFGVIQLADGDERASGPLAALAPGQSVRLVGRWTRHQQYGPTFAATFYEQVRPRSTDGLVAFLCSERFSGVGPALARRLVASFGLDLAGVLETEPGRLAEVRGVSPRLAERVGAAWREAGALAAVVERLAAVGVPAPVAQQAHRWLGDDALERLDADPYALLDVRGARWAHAEALARDAGLDRLDERRLVAGAVAGHGEACAAGGHLALETDALVAAAGRLLVVDRLDARRAVELASARGALVADDDVADTRWWYRPADRDAEVELAEHLARLAAARSRVTGAVTDPDLDPDLTDEQRAAVTAALTRGVCVLTGGPGTGKTRTVQSVVRACEDAGLRLALCAPTGRAARRLEELTGHAASTIHRLLEARGVPGEGFRFAYDTARQLPHDVVVADEASMADLRLALALARAVSSGSHLVVVGDADQLPSVGPGAVLRDLLLPAAAPLVTSTRLTVVHRQAARSRIVTLAHEINAGALDDATYLHARRDGDVFAVPEHTEAVAARVAAIVAERAPAYFDVAPSDVQVLAPMYKGPAGVDALNAALKERLNPARGRPSVAGFHEGDRVVQTRNDAEAEVANGDVGEVASVDRADGSLQVAFPQGLIDYDAQRAADLAPAWCLTVHKSQGGEWPVVVVVLDAGHRVLLWRELVYTAVSRAARGLLLVGAPHLLAAAGRRPGAGAGGRRTGLAARLGMLAQHGDHGKYSGD